MKPKRGERQRDPERVTRSLFAGGGNGQAERQPLDPFQQLLRLLGDSKRESLAVVQLLDSSSSDGARKLVESCAKLAQGSARTAEMVKPEEPQDVEYGYQPEGRLNAQQSAKAMATLLDACHMGMRAVLETANGLLEQQQQQGRGTDASGDKAGEGGAAAPTTSAPSSATASSQQQQQQLWRCAINVATALQDASRLLAAPSTYLAYTSSDPSCDALLSVGELAATVMRRASAAAAAATLAARAQVQARGGEEAAVLVPGGLLIEVPAGAAPLAKAEPAKAEGEAGEAAADLVKVEAESTEPQLAAAAAAAGPGGDVEMTEAEAGVKPEAATAGAKQEQQEPAAEGATASGWVAPAQPPDVCCLLASHGYSLLLVACEQQPESLLDSVLQQPGGAQRMQHVTSAALELAAVRITETAYCDDTPRSACPGTGTSTSSALANGTDKDSSCKDLTGTSTGSSSSIGTSASDASVSFQVRQLQLVALRFAELLTDDGNTQLEAKRALLPALCEALLAEPRRCVDWWGCGRPAVLSALQQPQLAQAQPLGGGPPAVPAPTAAAAPSPPAGGSPSPATEPEARAGAEEGSAAPGGGGAASMLPPACPSNHEVKLTTCAVGMLLKNPASRSTCMPLLLGCVRLPGPGGAAASLGLPSAPSQGGYPPHHQAQGLQPHPGASQPQPQQPQPNWSAFGESFRTERFMAVGTGDEREELYVGGRGRGYKKTRVLNPEAHGVDCDAVGLVTAAMATSLEYAVLLCKLLANASVGAPPVPLDDKGGAQGEQQQQQQKAGVPKQEGGGGGGDVQVKAEPGAVEGGKAGAAAGRGQDLHLLPLASAFRRMLEDRYSSKTAAPQGAAKPASAAEGAASEGEAALAALDATPLLPQPGELALSAALERVAVNLAAVLSLLQPVCPAGGQDIRASLAVLQLPTLRWPRMSVRLPQLLGVEDVELLLGVAEDLCTTTAAFRQRLQELRRQRHAERRRIRERYQLPKKPAKGQQQQQQQKARQSSDAAGMPQLTRLLRRSAACPVGQSDSEDEAAAAAVAEQQQARAVTPPNGMSAARAPGGLQPVGMHPQQQQQQQLQQQQYRQQTQNTQQHYQQPPQALRAGPGGPAAAAPYSGMAGGPMAPTGAAAAAHMQQQQGQLKRPRVSEEGAAGMVGPRGFDPAGAHRVSGSGVSTGPQAYPQPHYPQQHPQQQQQQQPPPRLSSGGGGGGILMASMASMAARGGAGGAGGGGPVGAGGGGGGPSGLPRFPSAGGPSGLPSHASGGPMGSGPASLPSFGGVPPQAGGHAGPLGLMGRTTMDTDEWVGPGGGGPGPGPRGAAPAAPRSGGGPASLPRFDAPGGGPQGPAAGGGMPYHQQQQQQHQQQQHGQGGQPPQYAAHGGGHQQEQQQYRPGLQAALAGGPASLPMFQQPGAGQQMQQQQQPQYRGMPPGGHQQQPQHQQYYSGGGGM